MPKLIVTAVTLDLLIGSMPAFAQATANECPSACLNSCAIKEPEPGLYRGECESNCDANCYRTFAEGKAKAGKQSTVAKKSSPKR